MTKIKNSFGARSREGQRERQRRQQQQTTKSGERHTRKHTLARPHGRARGNCNSNGQWGQTPLLGTLCRAPRFANGRGSGLIGSPPQRSRDRARSQRSRSPTRLRSDRVIRARAASAPASSVSSASPGLCSARQAGSRSPAPILAAQVQGNDTEVGTPLTWQLTTLNSQLYCTTFTPFASPACFT